MDYLKFNFKEDSLNKKITKFTQRGEFRLISDQVVQKGPSFKQDMESWIDAATGKVTVQISEKGKEKRTTKRLNLPPDISNGLLLTLVKNVNPSAETTVSMVAASSKPRLVKLNIVPAQEKTIKVGTVTHRAQHYIIKTKIGGAAGVIAPVIGKQPPDIHIWVLKSEAPTFVDFDVQGVSMTECQCTAYACPCRSNGHPDHGSCDAADFTYIKHGHYGKVDMSGFKAAVVGDLIDPDASKVHATVYFDKHATTAQQ